MTQPHNGMTVGFGDQLFDDPSLYQGIPFTQLDDQFWVLRDKVIPPEIAASASWLHPRGIRYDIPAGYRAAAAALQHPAYVLTGFGALALYGLTYFADSCDTVLMSPTLQRNRPATAQTPALVRGSAKPGESWTVTCRSQPINVAAPPLAVVQALGDIRTRRAAWEAMPASGRDPVFTRAVQLVDATRQQLNLDSADILKASRNRLDKAWVADALAASSRWSESPKETEMRLLAEAVAEGFGLVLLEQVPLKRNGKYVTRLDLALPELKIGLMYDGAHHWDRDRRAKDAAIDIESAAQGWIIVRISVDTLPQLVEALTAIIQTRMKDLAEQMRDLGI